MTKLKLTSWNVNGIRACLKKEMYQSIQDFASDIFCIQETKAQEEQVEEDFSGLGYKHKYWNSATKKGYSGTAIYSKVKALNVVYDMELGEDYDNEGRVITLEFENFFLTTVYTPNSKRALERLDYRKVWDEKFLDFVKEFEKKKPMIFCGDLNVAHTPIDIKNDKSNMTTEKKPGSAGFTDTERTGFDNILKRGFVDTFRFLHPEKIQYSWWSYMFNSRANNTGWRIDYFCISESLKDKLISATIHDQTHGSDHCPVEIEIEL